MVFTAVLLHVLLLLTLTVTLNLLGNFRPNNISDSIEQNYKSIKTYLVVYQSDISSITLKMASGGSYKTPPLFSDSKPYSRWVDEIHVWQTVTELEIKKQGPAIALSLPEESSIRDKVFSELGVDKLHTDDGVKTLITFLDKIYKQDELSAAYEVYTQFDRYKKTPNMTMENYLIEFDKLYNKTRKYNMALPEAVLAFKLLEGASLPHKDRQLVLTGVNYSDVNHLYKQMSQSLNKFFGRQSLPSSEVSEQAIKVEPTYLTQGEEIFMAQGGRGYSYRRGAFNNRNRYRGNKNNFSGRGNSSSSNRDFQKYDYV